MHTWCISVCFPQHCSIITWSVKGIGAFRGRSKVAVAPLTFNEKNCKIDMGGRVEVNIRPHRLRGLSAYGERLRKTETWAHFFSSWRCSISPCIEKNRVSARVKRQRYSCVTSTLLLILGSLWLFFSLLKGKFERLALFLPGDPVNTYTTLIMGLEKWEWSQCLNLLGYCLTRGRHQTAHEKVHLTK